MEVYDPTGKNKMTLVGSGQVMGGTKGEVEITLTGADGKKHKIVKIHDGATIDSNPCRWIYWGGSWYYVCG